MRRMSGSGSTTIILKDASAGLRSESEGYVSRTFGSLKVIAMIYTPRVSLIVPVYNSECTLEACIDSLLELDYPKKNMELIFVNNASTDRTADILERYRGEIEILYEEKRGPAAARNKGLLNARGDVAAFTDSDCITDKGWLQEIVLPLRDDNIGVAGGKILAGWPCNEIEKFGEKIHDHYRSINEFKPPYAITMNWASRIDVLKEVGLFDESFERGEDVDLSYRIFQAGYKFAYIPEAVVYHRNEKNLPGLFHEGYLHGYYSILNLKAHENFLKKFGHRRFNLSSYADILSCFGKFVLGCNRTDSLCYIIFNSGKKIGKFFGSIRFFYADL
jgi:glycosyltransferase involved in cell wall biosynthesis